MASAGGRAGRLRGAGQRRYGRTMGRRSRRRRSEAAAGPAEPAPTTDYEDPEGNVLTLRDRLSEGTVRKLAAAGPEGPAAAGAEDLWQRRQEMLFERLAVRWTIAGLPLEDQKELLGRLRMAGADERRWVRETIDAHVRRHMPDLVP